MNHFIIIAGSPISNIEHMKPYITEHTHIICADGGAIHAHKLGIKPDRLVGDYDSIPMDLLEQYRNDSDIEVIDGEDQNCTDLEKALKLIPEHATKVDIFAALGGRMDHVFANILTLEKHGTPDRFCIHDANHEIRLLTKDFSFEGNIGDKIGIIPLREVTELSFDGLRYPAEGLAGPYTLGWLGTSNELTNKKATIHIKGGLVLFTHYKS